MPKLFGREPALWLGVIAAAVSLLGGFNLTALSGEQAALIVVALNAVLAAASAFLVRPIAPTAFTYAVGALAAVAAAYGFELSEQAIGSLNALVVAVLVLLSRGQVTPQETPVSKA